MNDLISPEYRQQNRLLHERERARGEPWGTSGRRYVEDVLQFIKETGAKTVLDYGCGSGTLKAGLVRAKFPFVAEYDPAIPGKDALPTPAELVVCTDVMEHVEPEKIPAVLDHIRSLALKAVYMVIACNDSQHMLPDGRSSHLTIKPPEWWRHVVSRDDWTIIRHIDHHKKVKIWISISK